MKNTTTITNGQPKQQKDIKEINEHAPRIAELYNMNKSELEKNN